MGRRSKRSRTGHDDQQRHVEGHILPLLYPSSRICTLHDLLVALILPSLQEYHASSSKPGAWSPTPSSSLAGKGPEVLMHTARAAGTDGASSGSDTRIQQNTPPSVASPPYLHASQVAFCPNVCQAASPTSLNHVLRQEPAATLDTNLRQQPATRLEMDAALSAVAHSLLVHEGDPEDYVSLLHQSYGVLLNTAPPIGRTLLEQRWSHQQVIDRVIQILFKQGRNSSNVLCFGFQQPRPRSSLERERTAPAGLACVTDNAAVRILNSQIWRRIHSRVGDLIMLHVLSYADIFHPLPRKCYIQVSGTSVLLSARQFKKPSKQALSMEKVSTESWDGSSVRGRPAGLNGRDSGKEKMHVHSSNAKSCTDKRSKERVTNVSLYNGSATTRKRRRPHSWQRRKMTKLTPERTDEGCSGHGLEPSRLHMEPESQEFPVTASDCHHSSFLDIIKGSPATQEKFAAAVRVEAAAVANCETSNRSHKMCEFIALQKACQPNQVKNHRLILSVPVSILSDSTAFDEQPKDITEDGQHNEQGRKGFQSSYLNICKQENTVPSSRNTSHYAVSVGTGRRLINRSGMFYRGKFPHHAGLPKSHLLLRLKPTYEDAAILFKAIFGKENLCISSICREHCFTCLKNKN